MPPKKKQLLLMRHAKSSWKNPALRDFDRPLNKRGKRDAPRMGKYLKQLQLKPDQIFSSPAERAKLTVLSVVKELNFPAERITWDENLYYDGAEAYLNAIRYAEDSSQLVMTVGHNPMTEDAISELSNHSVRKAIKTATIAFFEFNTESWKDIRFSTEALKWIVGPKDLN